MQFSKNNEAILYFHQGWTDIFNSLSLIKHYHIMYTVLHIVMRKDSQKFIDFYIKNFKNVIVHYIE